MKNGLENIQNRFLESISRMSDDFDLTGFVAKLYGLLYLNAKSLSLDEIVEALLQDLVYTNKTHDIFRNDDSVLILACKEKSEFKIPSTSLGFGWIKNIPKILKSPI